MAISKKTASGEKDVENEHNTNKKFNDSAILIHLTLSDLTREIICCTHNRPIKVKAAALKTMIFPFIMWLLVNYGGW